MKIVLVIPPSPFLIDDRAFPFLGPLQIAAVARDRGHLVRVADLTGYKARHTDVEHADPEVVHLEAERELLALVEEVGADLVGFYSLAAQHPTVVRLHAAVRAARPSAWTALGGPHASTAPERAAKDGFDFVVVADQGGGGGEPGFLALIDHVREKATWDTKPRIRARSEFVGDRIIREKSREPDGGQYQNDRWPLPARDLVDLASYRYTIAGERATSIVSCTGCPFACTYCSHWEGYRKLEMKSPGRVREEIRWVRDHLGWRGIMFYDDEINLRPDFMGEFLPMLREEGVVWRAFFKCGKNFMRDQVFAAMAASGCAEMCTGAESADPGILKAIKKGATLEDNTAFVRLCVKHGIAPKVFTQVGLPGETPETIEALRNWLVSMAGEGLANADVSITTPYEGTPIYDEPEKHQITYDKASLDYSKKVVLYKGVPGAYTSHVSHPRLTADQIVVARQWVEDEFRRAAGLGRLGALGKDDG